MRTRATALILLLALAAAAAASAAAPAPTPATLLREAEQRTGIRARAPVHLVVLSPQALRAKVAAIDLRSYPSAAQAYDERLYRTLGLLGPAESLRGPLVQAETAGLAGVYDPARRTVYVARGPGQAGAALRGFVLALDDQAYRTSKALSVVRGGRDSAMAARAATQGVADLFARVLPNPVPPPKPKAKAKRSTQGDSPIATFLTLEQQFPRATGLRWASVLYNVGGRQVALSSLKTLPTTTAQVFHVDAYLERRRSLPVELPADPGGYALVRDDTFGELDVRALLATFGVPRLAAAANGWAAGLSALYRGPAGSAFALRLDWATEADAQQWAAAVPMYVKAAFAAGENAAPASCAADTCWSLAARQIAFVRNGASTALVFAPTLDDAATLATALTPAG